MEQGWISENWRINSLTSPKNQKNDIRFISRSLPDPAFKRGNASAIFGAGSSLGINPTIPSSEESERFKPSKPVIRGNSQRKTSSERPIVRRSKSDVVSSRKAIERRRSRDLEKSRKSETSIIKAVNGKSRSVSPCEPSSPRSVSVNSIDEDTGTQLRGEENGVRYPLFVPVASGLVSQSRPRATKPVTKRTPISGRSQKSSNLNTAESSAKKPVVKPVKTQNGVPGQRVPKAKPSGNSSDSRKVSPSRHQSVSSQHSPGNRPRALSAPKRTLEKVLESSTLPRVKSPAKKPVNEIKPASESTCVPPTSSLLQEGEISRTSSQSSVCSSPGKLSHGEKRDNMSKIPSLARTPSVDKQETKIPSRNPPKSKIPSISKADNKPQKIKEPEAKKSQIPGLTRSDSNKGLTKSKIPSSSASTPGKPDSAKENKDPVFADEAQETKQHKPTSRIPSFSSGSKASKMPSRNQTQEDRVDSPNKVKSTGVPMSRIPSFGKGTVDKPSVSGPTVPSTLPLVQEQINRDSSSSDSKVPQETDTAPTPESRIPHVTPSKNESGVSQRSRIPGLTPRSAQAESKIPVTEKGDSSGGNHKQVLNGDPSLITPDIPSSTETKSDPEKQHPSTPAITNGNENLVENSPSEVKVPEVKTTNNELPPREESPIEKYIRSEAQKMEQLLRDETVVVEVRSETQTPDINDTSKAEMSESVQEKPVVTRTTKEKETAQVTTEVKKVESKLPSPEDKKIVQDPAGDLISDVLTSYAPDLKPSDKEIKLSRHQDLKPLEVKKYSENKVIASELKTDIIECEGNKKTAPEQIALQLPTQVKTDNHADKTVDDIYLQTFGSFGKKEDQDSPPSSRDKPRPMPPARTDSLGSKDAKDMGFTKKVEKPQALELKPLDSDSPEENVTPTETPAIDTLGQYEQQSRRSKSRTRKIISPDGDNDMDFAAAATREQPEVVRDIDKDKYGTSPYTTEDEKAKVPKKTTKHDKPKFVIESSLGKDFYEAKRDSVQDEDTRPDSLVIANKTVESSPDTEAEQKNTEFVEVQATPKDEFEDVDLVTQKESMKEIIQSMNDLDGKAKCIGCGGRGKCVIS